MSFDWPYFTLRNGVLYEEEISSNGRGGKVAPKLYRAYPGGRQDAPHFDTVGDAEAWLVDNDIRGSVRA